MAAAAARLFYREGDRIVPADVGGNHAVSDVILSEFGNSAIEMMIDRCRHETISIPSYPLRTVT